MPSNIIVMGILDTKAESIRFIRDQIAQAGGTPLVVEVSLGKETKLDWIDYPVDEVLRTIGSTPEALFKLPRKEAGEAMSKAAVEMVLQLYADGKVDGIIGFAGTTGTTICTAAMRALPTGIPKMMVTPTTNQPAGWKFVGTKDLCMVNPIAELGLNKITQPILTACAYGIVGMASAPKPVEEEYKPLIGLTMFGVTTPCVMSAAKAVEEAGNDTMIIHTTGVGGRCLEEQLSEGNFAGLLDLTTHELWAHEVAAKEDAGPDRMTAAVRKGIPQVVAPGALDFMLWETPDFPKKYKKEVEAGIPGRQLYSHAEMIRCPGTILSEIDEIGRLMAVKLNEAQKAPVCILVPMRGWSAADMCDGKIELGRAEPGPSAAWLPVEGKPEWSQRSVNFIESMKKHLDLDNPMIELYAVDRHLNDKEFGRLAGEQLLKMMNGTWEKGSLAGQDLIEQISR